MSRLEKFNEMSKIEFIDYVESLSFAELSKNIPNFRRAMKYHSIVLCSFHMSNICINTDCKYLHTAITINGMYSLYADYNALQKRVKLLSNEMSHHSRERSFYYPSEEQISIEQERKQKRDIINGVHKSKKSYDDKREYKREDKREDERKPKRNYEDKREDKREDNREYEREDKREDNREYEREDERNPKKRYTDKREDYHDDSRKHPQPELYHGQILRLDQPKELQLDPDELIKPNPEFIHQLELMLEQYNKKNAQP